MSNNETLAALRDREVAGGIANLYRIFVERAAPPAFLEAPLAEAPDVARDASLDRRRRLQKAG